MLYIMRHGKTDWNVLHKLQGRTDIPLNAEGRNMARKAAETYKDIHFDICYCSPLKRARETAEILLEGRNIPILFDDRLKEMSFGEYEGTKSSFSTENKYQAENSQVNILFEAPERYIPPKDGESFEDLYKRTGEFLKEVVLPQLKDEKDVLIIGHGAMNSSIVCQVKKIDIEHFWDAGIENCKLMKLL